MKPFASYIYNIISESGYFYQVKPLQNGQTSATLFFIKGLSPGVTTQIIVNDDFNYLMCASYSKYDYKVTRDFIEAMNGLNLAAPTGMKFFYVEKESNIYAMVQLFISGSYPNKAFVLDTIHYSVQSLKNALNKLDDFKTGQWSPALDINR